MITGQLWKSKYEATAQECARAFALSISEETLGLLMLDNATVVQKHDVIREPPRLADVMSYQNDLDAATLGIEQ